MHPIEWQAIRVVLENNEKARTDLACLARATERKPFGR